MVKSLISMVIVAILLIVGSFYEHAFVTRQFNEFSCALDFVYEKVDNKTAVEDDIYAIQSNWLNKKKYLHIFIPHNEIKEFDLWIAEAVKLVREEKWEDALPACGGLLLRYVVIR